MAKDKSEKKKSTYALATLPGANPDISKLKLKRLSKPAFVPIMKLEPGVIISGKVLAVTKSKITKKKGGKITEEETQQLQMQATDGSEMLLPINSVIQSAIGDPESVVGQTLVIKVLPRRVSPNFKREYFNCEVFVAE